MEQKFKEWTIKKCIGEGAFGKVYLIEREEFGHTYRAALKVMEIPKDSADVKFALDEGMSKENVTRYFYGMAKRIVDEFALMAKLKGNTNIVSYEDHLVAKKKNAFGWVVYIRMELLTPLYDYIKANKFTVRHVMKLGIDICNALEICQKYNIIHRDIKPENIFVSDLGDFKLGDFGIARELEHTASGLSRVGTKSYIAPEVYKGQEYNSTVDIYSLGLVMYRFLNRNRLPFMPPAPEKISFSDKEKAEMMRMSGQTLPKPCSANERLSEIILKACAYLPKDRFENAGEMKRALLELLHGDSAVPAARNQENGVDTNTPEEETPEDSIRQKRRLGIMMLILAGILLCGFAILFANGTQGNEENQYLSEGDEIYFGHYWQEDTNGDGKADPLDKKQPVLWKVLSVNGDDAFLLSVKNLNCMKYKNAYENTTWEKSDIRVWLNVAFYNDAFSRGEKELLLDTELANEPVKGTSADGGRDTKDKIFLLSIYDAYNTIYGFKGKEESESRKAEDTSYTKQSGIGLRDVSEHVSVENDWWLRTPGKDNKEACIIGAKGEAYYADVNCADIGIRPALHMKISKSGWKKKET